VTDVRRRGAYPLRAALPNRRQDQAGSSGEAEALNPERNNRRGERAGSAGCGRAKEARQVRAVGIATLLNLPAFLIPAVAYQGVQHVAHGSTRAMRLKQPGDVQAAGAFAPPAADFDHLRPAFRYIAQRDHVARHGMQHNRKGRQLAGRPRGTGIREPVLFTSLANATNRRFAASSFLRCVKRERAAPKDGPGSESTNRA